MIFKWLKKKKLFSFSWSFFLLLIALAVIIFGLRLAGKAYENKDGADQWGLKDGKSSYELKEFLN